MSDPLDALLVRFSPPGGRGEPLVFPCPPDLRFDRSVPGGAKTLSCTLYFPAGTATPPALTELAEVRVIDRRTGATVWYGDLTDPGLTAGPGGQRYAITAGGAQGRLDGWRRVYGLVDRAQESWQPVGDFAGASSSFSGDLTPPGDYDLDPIDFGDLTDGWSDIGIDFGDGDLFGGDTGDWGTIDFGGADYPPVADYPGYMGYLQDPSGGPGDMLPIPLGIGGGGGWDGWEEGSTASGGSSSGVLAAGSIDPGAGATTRKKISGSLMMTPGYMDEDGPFWSTPPTGIDNNVIGTVSVDFRLMDAGSVARLMMWADATLLDSGYVIEASMSGTVTLIRLDGGAETVLDTQAWTPTTGHTYTLMLSTNGTLTQYAATLLTGPYDIEHEYPTATGFAYDPDTADVWDVSYVYPTDTYHVVSPDVGEESSWVLHDGQHWGVGASGGVVEFENIIAVGSSTPE